MPVQSVVDGYEVVEVVGTVYAEAADSVGPVQVDDAADVVDDVEYHF